MLERRIDIRPAYDKRSTGHGIHGADMVFSIGDSRGWITWVLLTGWELPSTRLLREYCRAPTPAGCDYHSPVRTAEWQHESPCHLLGTCYSDGTSLTEDLFELLIAEGTDGLWKELQRQWVIQFGDPDVSTPP